ncbi:hypothetical protein BGZ83_001036, partial [Gryganskiella cystojenkinii]
MSPSGADSLSQKCQNAGKTVTFPMDKDLHSFKHFDLNAMGGADDDDDGADGGGHEDDGDDDDNDDDDDDEHDDKDEDDEDDFWTDEGGIGSSILDAATRLAMANPKNEIIHNARATSPFSSPAVEEKTDPLGHVPMA